MKNLTFLSLLICGLIFLSCNKDKEPIEIVVEAGSVDALNAAIDEATSEDNGVVRLASGIHTESSMITISKKVKIIGDDGAILKFDTKADLSDSVIHFNLGLHIVDIDEVCIENIEFRPVEAWGGVTILLENSSESIIKDCEFYDHQISIAIELSNNVLIENNIIQATSDPSIYHDYGLVVINGKGVQIIDNDFSNGYFAAWVGDEDGIFSGNTVTTTNIGVIPCAVPDSSSALPRANFSGTMIPGKRWTFSNNHFHDNASHGMLLYDGASECIVEDNTFSNNGIVDIELAGFSTTFGFDAPPSKDNIANLGPTVTYKDCGEGNMVTGGIDQTLLDCF